MPNPSWRRWLYRWRLDDPSDREQACLINFGLALDTKPSADLPRNLPGYADIAVPDFNFSTNRRRARTFGHQPPVDKLPIEISRQSVPTRICAVTKTTLLGSRFVFIGSLIFFRTKEPAAARALPVEGRPEGRPSGLGWVPSGDGSQPYDCAVEPRLKRST
jgi:hypothetical protein